MKKELPNISINVEEEKDEPVVEENILDIKNLPEESPFEKPVEVEIVEEVKNNETDLVINEEEPKPYVNLKNLKKIALMKLCKERKLTNYSKLNKGNLILLLQGKSLFNKNEQVEVKHVDPVEFSPQLPEPQVIQKVIKSVKKVKKKKPVKIIEEIIEEEESSSSEEEEVIVRRIVKKVRKKKKNNEYLRSNLVKEHPPLADPIKRLPEAQVKLPEPEKKLHNPFKNYYNIY